MIDTCHTLTPINLFESNFPILKPILIVRANFYAEITKKLSSGAVDYLKDCSIDYRFLDLFGAMEIPAAIKLVLDKNQYSAFIALGCVIRGETGHYDVVVNSTIQGLLDLTVHYGAVIGNGVLTVENFAQAEQRANPNIMNKGGHAARAAVNLLQTQQSIDVL